MSREPTRNRRKLYLYLGILLAEFLVVGGACLWLSSTPWGQAILASDEVALPIYFMAKYVVPAIAIGGFLLWWLGLLGLAFAFTLLVSASLMFIIEPMFAKMVLPLLGGAPMVWNTCMVFYQAVLLAGYVYAHVSTKSWGTRKQAKIHLLALCTVALVWVVVLAWLVLPIRPGSSGGPTGGANPIPWLLGFMLMTVGLPMFVISASAPMLQAWFVDTGHKSGKDPYFLYAASNLGSLGALIAYPLVIERNLTLGIQTWCWTGGFALLMALTAGCAVWLWRSRGVLVPVAAGTSGSLALGRSRSIVADAWAPVEAPAAVKEMESRDHWSRPAELAAEPTLWRRLRWLALAFAPSSLLLGVTSYSTEDVASFPLIWIIPLALYLLTFVLVFSRTTTLPYRAAKWAQSHMDRFFDGALPKWLATGLKAVLGWPIDLLNPHKVMVLLQPVFLVLVLLTTLSHKSVLEILGWVVAPHFEMILMHLAAFFVTAMVCHGELARTRPAAKHLTEFYLWMSVGGVLGGIFTALVAPAVFNAVYEYPLMIGVACLLRPQVGTFRFPVFSRWMDVLLPAALLTVLSGLMTLNHCDHKAHQESKWQAQDEWHKVGGHSLPKGHWLRPTNQWLNEVLPLFEANKALAKWFGPEEPTFEDSDLSEEEQLKAIEDWKNRVEAWKPLPEEWDLKATATLLALGVIVVFLFQFRPIRFGLGVLILMAFFVRYHDEDEVRYHRDDESGTIETVDKVIYQKRSFFGVLRVLKNMRAHITPENHGNEDELSSKDIDYLTHTLRHGTTDHGTQRFDNGWRQEPTSYYFRASKLSKAKNSPLADVFEKLIDPRVRRQIGVCGLGTGTTAAYGERGQTITYFEIDPAVVDIDTTPRFKDPISREELPFFSYKRDAEARGVTVEVKLGDARQTLAREDNGKYDLLVLDAFSSDAIPVHLLTKEAVEMYFKKLKADGVLMVHISNRHLDLAPVVGNIAKALDKAALRFNDDDDAGEKSMSDWIALANADQRLAPLLKASEQEDDPTWLKIPKYKKTVVWTDDFSNIIDVLDWWRKMNVDHPATTPEERDTELPR